MIVTVDGASPLPAEPRNASLAALGPSGSSTVCPCACTLSIWPGLRAGQSNVNPFQDTCLPGDSPAAASAWAEYDQPPPSKLAMPEAPSSEMPALFWYHSIVPLRATLR